ncbi:STN domain-containing protein [Arachidicoccus ginsenosidivorans]|uniref:STN domain-containing protein n=1 Tax=Arachidicoccus ginsenosidivorans TaxID=496057 RepID=UPI001CEF8A1C|nr:STN domain-containing protein [Arachidicoccus ginsenosidivorans]
MKTEFLTSNSYKSMEKNTVHHLIVQRKVVHSRQILLVMRLTIIMLLFALTQVQAKGYAQEVTLHASSISLKQTFLNIEQQTGYSFFYKNADIQGKELSSLNLTKQPLKAALTQILSQQGLAFVIKKKTIFVRREFKRPSQNEVVTPEVPQQTTLKGHVTDRAGVALNGVAILVKGTGKGAITDGAGNFPYSCKTPKRQF